MIFVTLGSQKFPFDRLLKAVDGLIEDGTIGPDVFAQTGASTYLPKHYPYQAFLDHDLFQEKMDHADLIITHGGTGAIITALKAGKRVIAVPRLAEFGEHVDDHQKEIVSLFEGEDLILSVEDMRDLGPAVKEAGTHVFKKYVSNTKAFLSDIRSYLDGLSGE